MKSLHSFNVVYKLSVYLFQFRSYCLPPALCLQWHNRLITQCPAPLKPQILEWVKVEANHAGTTSALGSANQQRKFVHFRYQWFYFFIEGHKLGRATLSNKFTRKSFNTLIRTWREIRGQCDLKTRHADDVTFRQTVLVSCSVSQVTDHVTHWPTKSLTAGSTNDQNLYMTKAARYSNIVAVLSFPELAWSSTIMCHWGVTTNYQNAPYRHASPLETFRETYTVFKLQ